MMKILFLGYNQKQTGLINFLKKRNHKIFWSNDRDINTSKHDLIISFGYRYIMPVEKLNEAKRPIINLHISYLPFNKGAHPNFWSHYENTKTGITIHEIDKGIDTGNIIYRKNIKIDDALTLKESHALLLNKIELLFKKNITEIEEGSYKTIPTKLKGTYHQKKDLPDWVSWDLTIKEVKKRGK